MSRITAEERKRFHNYLDEAIDKLNSPKNIKKEHWSNLSTHTLFDLFKNENYELDDAIDFESNENIIDECYDNINFPLFIIDNLRRNK